MPYVNNQGVRIHCEVEGAGPPLALLYGLTGYLEFWHDSGYVDSLRGDYKLILIGIRRRGIQISAFLSGLGSTCPN